MRKEYPCYGIAHLLVHSKICFVKGQSFKDTKENLPGTSLKRVLRWIAPVLKPGWMVTIYHRCKSI
jgi:hypothetical protein